MGERDRQREREREEQKLSLVSFYPLINKFTSAIMSKAKMLCLSYYCLYLLFNKIGEKGRTGSPSKQGGGGRGRGQGGETAQTMSAHMNK
jgi:hypothetical protein